MKKFCILFFVFCFGQSINLVAQTSPRNFVIRNVYISLNADTRYVRKLANRTISWDGPTRNEQIECFKSELTKTGLFNVVKTDLEKLNGSDEFNLNVTLTFRDIDPNYKIKDIKLEGYDDIDVHGFRSRLAKLRDNKDRLFLRTDFPFFERQVAESIKENQMGGSLNEDLPLPWIEIKLNSAGSLNILVMPQFVGCK